MGIAKHIPIAYFLRLLKTLLSRDEILSVNPYLCIVLG